MMLSFSNGTIYCRIMERALGIATLPLVARNDYAMIYHCIVIIEVAILQR
jgi:hypothetical protein